MLMTGIGFEERPADTRSAPPPKAVREPCDIAAVADLLADPLDKVVGNYKFLRYFLSAGPRSGRFNA